MVCDDGPPGCENCCNDGTQSNHFGIQIQRDGACCTALLECSVLQSAGDKTKERANLVASLAFTRQHFAEGSSYLLSVERKRFANKLLFPLWEIVIDRPLGGATARYDLIDSGSGEA